MTVIDEFQQLNLFMFELLFFFLCDCDMSVKTIVKFVVSLSSLLKKKGTNYLKNIIFLLNFGLLLNEMGPLFFFFFLVEPWAGPVLASIFAFLS